MDLDKPQLLVEQEASEAGRGAQLRDPRSSIRALWTGILGPKAQGGDVPLLRTSVGLRRIVRLLKALELQLGIVVPATTLVRLGTVDALATAVECDEWPALSPCVLMKDGDDRPPLYFVSAASGLVLELCDLARAIDYRGRVWGLQAPGLDGECAALTDVRALARHYQAALEAHHGGGRLHLVGYSFGGLVALELARGLVAAGREVGLVGLIDSNIDEKFWPKRVWFLGVLKRCLKRAADARRLPPKQAFAHIWVRARKVIGYFFAKARGETEAAIHRSSYYIGGLEPNFQTVRDCAITAFEVYRPTKTELNVTLFKSELGDPHACDPVPIWRRVVKTLEVVMIPGSHTTMVRPPFSHKLAAEIVARV
jgi:thioesterase domain-containing protein